MRREKIIASIREVLKEKGITKAYLCGSFARKERRYRDIDVLIEPPERFSLLDLVHVEGVLEAKVNKKFDLLTFGGLSPYIKPYIEKDMVRII
jgi:predicted nucleotidyltransferase